MVQMTDEQRLLTPVEVAIRLRRSEATVWRWLRVQKSLPPGEHPTP